MAQINTFQDLLDLLDSNPQYLQDLRVRLLSEELIALPEKFAELVAQVSDLGVQVSELRIQVAGLNARLDEFIAATDRRFEALESNVKVLKDDVKVLKEDVRALKVDMGDVKGRQTESWARDNILNIAKDAMGLTRGRLLLSGSRDLDSQLRSALDQAEARGLVTEDEVDDLLVTDIIIRARRATDRQYVYAVFEVSHVINNRDIDRARDRAKTIATVTGEEAVGVALGGFIHPRQLQRAETEGVQVVIPASFRMEPAGEDND